jgi:hypothetical protein
VKKLICIGVAVALLAMVVMPVAVGADYTPTVYNSTYSKIPFGILSTGIALIANLTSASVLGTALGLPTWLPDALNPIADWVGGPFAWLTELTAWSMVAVGDVVAKASGLLSTFGVTIDISGVSNLTYVIANRIFDTGNIPTSEMTSQLPPALGLL